MPWSFFILPAFLGLWLLIQILLWGLILPFKIRKKQTSKIRAELPDVLTEELSPEMRDYIGRCIHEFRGQGFEVIFSHRHEGVANAIGHQFVVVNPRTSDVGTIIVVQSIQGRVLTFSIVSRFSDDSVISTGTTRSIGGHPRNPVNDTVSFPWVKSVAVIYEAHRRRLAKAGRLQNPRVAPAAANAAEYVQRMIEKEHEWWIKCGYEYADESAGLYRLTWKGAYLLAWKLNPRIRRWRTRRRDRKARTLWNELGMDRFSTAAPQATVPVTAPIAPAVAMHPAAAAQAAEPFDRTLQYHALLGEGAIQAYRSGDATVIRSGSIPLGTFLLKSAAIILCLGIFAMLLATTSYRLWQLYRLRQTFPMLAIQLPIARIVEYMLVWLAFFVLEIWVLRLRWKRGRGVVLSASSAGVRVFDSTGTRLLHHLAREDIFGFRVIIDSLGSRRGRRYRLEARMTQMRPIRLIHSSDKLALQEARAALLKATGMVVDDLESGLEFESAQTPSIPTASPSPRRDGPSDALPDPI